MKIRTSFLKMFYLSLFFLYISVFDVNGQHRRDLSAINFQGAKVKFPHPPSMDNYNNQSDFVIYPDHHLTQKWVKGGAYFKYKGNKVRAENVTICVYLPKNGNNWAYREHNESNVNAPDWSGWWHEPWNNGFFMYSVKARYNGYDYERVFEVNRNAIFVAIQYAKQGLELYMKYQSGR